MIVNDEQERDLSKFMIVPDIDDEKHCYEAFYDATSNDALFLKTCPVCGREKLSGEGEETFLLSDPTISEILMTTTSDIQKKDVVLQHLLEVNEGGVHCWMCFECSRALGRHVLPKLAIANNLWIWDVPYQLSMLTIPEQLLIARHYTQCYILKLYPRDGDMHIPHDQLYSAMAGNASLFKLNIQQVVEMLKGQ